MEYNNRMCSDAVGMASVKSATHYSLLEDPA